MEKKTTSRKNEIVINRLRAGHTLLTHIYLMEGYPVAPCEFFSKRQNNSKHLITSCAELTDLRLRCLGDSIPNIL